MVFRGCNVPQVLEQCHYGQICIKIATKYIKQGHQSQQKIEIWWKFAFGGPNLGASKSFSEPKFMNFVTYMFLFLSH